MEKGRGKIGFSLSQFWGIALKEVVRRRGKETPRPQPELWLFLLLAFRPSNNYSKQGQSTTYIKSRDKSIKII